MRVDQIAVLFGVKDEQVRVWIRTGKLAAESHTWRGKPYYLVTQAEVDRILMAGDRPFAAGALVGAGERGSTSPLALGGVLGGLIAAGTVARPAHGVLIAVGALVVYCALIAGLWGLAMVQHTRTRRLPRDQRPGHVPAPPAP